MNAVPTDRLRSLIGELLEDEERWREHVAHDPDERGFSLIDVGDPDVEVWVVSWMPGQATGFHDHDVSAAAVVVAAGEVCEERLVLGGAPAVRRLGAGDGVTIAPTAIHCVSHVGDAPAVTIHAYSPPLARMGAYEVDPDGVLLRHPHPAHARLRPVAA